MCIRDSIDSGFQFCSGMNAPYCPTSPVINMCTGPGTDIPESGSSTTPPISGSNGSADLPNLTMRDVYLLDANKNQVPSIHVNKNFYCHMNVKMCIRDSCYLVSCRDRKNNFSHTLLSDRSEVCPQRFA